MAMQTAIDMMIEGDMIGEDRRDWLFQVVDEDFWPVMTLRFRDADQYGLFGREASRPSVRAR